MHLQETREDANSPPEDPGNERTPAVDTDIPRRPSSDSQSQTSSPHGGSGRSARTGTPPVEAHNDIDDADAVEQEEPDLQDNYMLDLMQLPPEFQPPGRCTIARNMSFFPDYNNQPFDLLSHYLSRTALCMGNGSTDVNPFITQLVPLCFADGLILELVLCQSAAHRAMEDSGAKGIAQRRYVKSLGRFQKSIDDYVNGQESNPLWIAVGALIMCFIEVRCSRPSTDVFLALMETLKTAKGDVHGVIFDHVNAAGQLLTKLLLSDSPSSIRGDLRNFIVEYYVYAALISMISIDPVFGTTTFLNPDLEVQAMELVQSGYIGQLCGCWLELLVLLPQVFAFGRRARAPDSEPSFPTADDFMTFSSLQAQIISFAPFPSPGSDVALCGYIFQQALHLYLLTAVPGSYEAMDGPRNVYIERAIDQAFEYLGQLPSTARINTSLCWALAVIGSCLLDEHRRNELRDRLETMFFVLGLGNIQKTLALLEQVWELPSENLSPWTICRVMQDTQMWISFA